MQAKLVSYNGMSYIISRKKVCFASVSMQLKQDGIIYVTAPILMPQFMLSKILKSKEEWFRKQIAQYALQRKEKKTY